MPLINGVKALNYELTVDGYTRQAHVDHILPCPRTVNDVSNNLRADTVPHLDDDVVPMPIVDCELVTLC